MTDPDRSIRRTLDAIMVVFDAHDLVAIMEFFAEDCSVDTAAGPSRGGSDSRDGPPSARGWQRGSPPSPTCSTPPTGTGSAVTWRSPSGSSPGRRATAPPFRARGCEHWEFRDGSIIRRDSYWKRVED